MIQFFVRLYYKIVEKIIYNFIKRKLLSEGLSQDELGILHKFGTESMILDGTENRKDAKCLEN